VAVVHEAEVLRRVGIGAAASHHRASQRCIDGVAVNSRKGEHGLAVASRVADRAFGEFAIVVIVGNSIRLASGVELGDALG